MTAAIICPMLVSSAFLAMSPAQAATVKVATASTVIINEVSTANYSLYADEDDDYGDWVELYNTSAATVDLTGWGLSAAAKNPFRWVFPSGTTLNSGSYLRVWADKKDRSASTSKLHTNFNLDNDGTSDVVLSAPNQTALGVVVDDSGAIAKMSPNLSWCRMPNGVASSAFSVCLTPTPAKANSGSTTGSLLAAPKLSPGSGLYKAGTTVTATGPSGATLRYTTDGSEPTASSATVPTSGIPVTKTTTLRVSAFQSGYQTSTPITGTYIFDAAGTYTGQRMIYLTMNSTDAKEYVGKGTAPAAGWKSNVEMIDEGGTDAFNTPARTDDAGAHGSRLNEDMYPIDIKFKDALGTSKISYKVFTGKATTSFDRLRLRNAGYDYQEAHVRDQYWQAVGSNEGLSGSAGVPAQVFVNGTYLGMMDLREKEDEGLVSSDLGTDKDNVQFLSNGVSVAADGANTSYDAMYNYISGNDMSNAANYAKASTLLDVTSFAEDFALHMYSNSRDWQDHNLQAFRALDYDGKWHFRPHDFDVASNGSNSPATYKTAPSVDMNDQYNAGASGTLMRALLKNSTFKNLYANVIADQLNTVMSTTEGPATAKALTDPMAKYIPAQVAKWGSPKSVIFWQQQVQLLSDYFAARTPYYVDDTASYLGVGALKPVNIATADPKMGTVQVNTVNLATRMTKANTSWTGNYWATVPVTLTAVPVVGYSFAGWTGASTSSAQTITVTPGTSTAAYTATFTKLATIPAPVIATVATARTAVTDTAVSLQLSATDPNGYAVAWKDKGLPSGVSINATTGLIYGRPTVAGSYSSTLTATNGTSKSTVSIVWTVTNKLDRTVTLPTAPTGDGTGLSGAYYANSTFAGTAALTRTELPACTLAAGASIASGLPSSGWAVRWTGTITVPTTGTYSLQTVIRSDDASRVTVAGKSVFDAWKGGVSAPSGTVDLVAGTPTAITVDFTDISDAASLSLKWKLPGATAYTSVPIGVLNPA